MPDLQEQKRRLRDAMRERRTQAAGQNKNDFKALAELFKHHVKPEPGAIIGGYLPFRDEIDPAVLIAALRRSGHRVALPVIVGKRLPLAFYFYQPGDALVAHALGFLEPDPAAATPVIPDIILVPLLAFDRSRNRLGYGGGYYDRTLAALRKVKKIIAVGLAYACQEVDHIPIGAHDQRLDHIVTEVNIF